MEKEYIITRMRKYLADMPLHPVKQGGSAQNTWAEKRKHPAAIPLHLIKQNGSAQTA
jgi:hypothetical protein